MDRVAITTLRIAVFKILHTSLHLTITTCIAMTLRERVVPRMKLGEEVHYMKVKGAMANMTVSCSTRTIQIGNIQMDQEGIEVVKPQVRK